MASASKWQEFLKTVQNPDALTIDEKKRWNQIVGASSGEPGQPGFSYGKFTNLSSDQAIQDYKTAYEEANAANEARYQAGLGKLTGLESLYALGGGFGTGQLADIEAQKRKDVAAGTQSLVRSGLANTTIMSALPKAWEQDVGSRARLSLADLQTSKYAGAVGQTVDFMERKTEAAPDPSLYANMLQAASVGDVGGSSYSYGANKATPVPATPQFSTGYNTAVTSAYVNPVQSWTARQGAAIQEKSLAAKKQRDAIRAATEAAAFTKRKVAYESKYN